MKWEYDYEESTNHKAFVDKADEMGKEGWELVQVEDIKGFTVGYFKRIISEK